MGTPINVWKTVPGKGPEKTKTVLNLFVWLPLRFLLVEGRSLAVLYLGTPFPLEICVSLNLQLCLRDKWQLVSCSDG